MKNKILIIIPFIFAILVMSVGYSLLETELKFEGYVTIYGEWNVAITNISASYVSDYCIAGNPQFDGLKASFDAYLMKPTDYITYEITLANKGTIDAKLENVELNFEEDENISVTYTNPRDILKAGETEVVSITITFKETATSIPNIKTKNIIETINYVQV